MRNVSPRAALTAARLGGRRCQHGRRGAGVPGEGDRFLPAVRRTPTAIQGSRGHARNVRKRDHVLTKNAVNICLFYRFDEDLRQLSAIPILPNLMDNAELRPFGAFNEMYADVCNTATSTSSGSVKTSGNQSSAGSEKMEACTSNTYSRDGTNDTIAVCEPNETTISENDRIGISLLDWISADKGQNALKRLAAECNRGLDQLEETNMKTLKDNVNKSVGFFQRVRF